MQITVNAKSRFGIKDEVTDKWFNPADKQLLGLFQVGKTYDVILKENKGKDGKIYQNIDSAIEVQGVTPQVTGSVTTVAPAAKKAFYSSKPYKKAESSGLSKEEWASKDHDKMIGGLSHDAVILAAASVQNGLPMDKLVEAYKLALVGLIKVRGEVK